MTDRLSILQIASTGARVGVSGVVSLLARELVALGHEVTVVALIDGPLVETLRAEGIEAAVLPTHGPFEPMAVLRMRRFLGGRRFDVLHSHGQRAMFVGNVAARLVGTRAVVTSFHEVSTVKRSNAGPHRLYARAEGLLSRITDACVATSDAVREDAVRARGVPRAKLTRIDNAVDSARYHPVADRAAVDAFRERLGLGPPGALIGALGSLNPVKGHAVLIEALALLRPRLSAARVVLAGVGPLRESLDRLASERGLGDAMRFLGDVEETLLFYNAIDVLALPSLAESCPLVVLEAMACGTPVVGSAVGAVPELLEGGRSGVLVPPSDPAALAEALLRVLRDPAERTAMGRRGRERVGHAYAPEPFVRNHEALYARLLEPRR